MLTRRLNSRTRGLLEITPAGVVDYLHRTVKDWMGVEGTLWLEIKDDKPENYGRVASILDKLATALKTAHKNGGSRQILPAWVNLELPPAQDYGFVALAAEFGIATYVRAKVDSDPNYLLFRGDETDLIWRIVLGPGPAALPQRELDILSKSKGDIDDWNDYLSEMRRFRVKYIDFNPAGRYRLACDLIRTTSERVKDPTALRKLLIPLRREVVQAGDGRKKQDDFGILVPVSDSGSRELPYWAAVVELLESYGGKDSLGRRIGNTVASWLR
ncbi:hypothetical protein MFIFM68171_06061 [Madurella fahalii]|uniref:Uncharacterized protein n=1 Tax=Madurella fahalii TaxID=1157608 RepID=A0ABQ0GDN3_9PEZI